MKKAIVFKNVSKNYKQLKAVDGISLTIEKGNSLVCWDQMVQANQH